MFFLNYLLVGILWSVSSGEDLEDGCVYMPNKNPPVPPRVIHVYQRGNLYSPGFEANELYPNNVRCTYELQASPGKHVGIRFNFLDIDATDGCQADRLNIFDYDLKGRGNIVHIYCGDQRPFDYVSQTHRLQVILRTDGTVRRRGFNITYWPQDDENVCRANQKQCRNRKCVDYSVVCNGNDDCEDGTDEEKCPGVSLPTAECGRPDVDPTTFADFDRIYGGKEAVPGSWPWMAELQQKLVEPNAHICGGVIINAQWVLTAAHCFVGSNSARFTRVWRVHVGTHHKFKRDPEEQIRYIDRIVIYDDIPSDEFEKEGKFDMVHDIALIKLNAPIKFGKFVKPICLPDPNVKLDSSRKCYATGWGFTEGTGFFDVLKQAHLKVQSDIHCKKLVGNVFAPKSMICVGNTGSQDGVCGGDSGGPLACKTSNGKWSVDGIASFIPNESGGVCGLSGSIFCRVSVKNVWIRKIVNKYS